MKAGWLALRSVSLNAQLQYFFTNMLNEVFWIFHPTPSAPSLLSAPRALIKAALLPPLNPWIPVRQKRCMLLNIQQCACFSSGSFINVPHFPNTGTDRKKKVKYGPLLIYLQTVHRNSVFFINRSKHEESIRKWKKHCELSQLQNVKNSKQPRERREQPGEYICRFTAFTQAT